MTQISKHINDPIHEYIELDSCSLNILDTETFQRLRGLHQLGCTYFVFPGATHKRFEHSLGVSHLANTLVNKFKTKQPELEINNRDIRCVTLAGLCHDLGHGPFSHLFDHEFIPRVRNDYNDNVWTHEKGSELLFNYLIDENNIDLPTEDVKYINQLIQGAPPSTTQNMEKGFLFDIVANKRNSLDVDKWDYIMRDCHNVGVKSGYDIKRLITFSKVIDNQICYDKKESFNIYELFHTRYSLFKRVYGHRVTKAVDQMVVDVLIKADPYLKISESIYNPEEYQYLTDSILDEISRSKAPELKEPRDIIKRIRQRNFYKLAEGLSFVGNQSEIIRRDQVTAENIATSQSVSESGISLTPDDIAVSWAVMGYSPDRNKNPINSVKLYSKEEPDHASLFEFSPSSNFLPSRHHSEICLWVFAKSPEKVSAVKIATRRLLQNIGVNPNFNMFTPTRFDMVNSM